MNSKSNLTLFITIPGARLGVNLLARLVCRQLCTISSLDNLIDTTLQPLSFLKVHMAVRKPHYSNFMCAFLTGNTSLSFTHSNAVKHKDTTTAVEIGKVVLD